MSDQPSSNPAAPVLSYATPTAYLPAGVWRDGKKLVAHRNAVFPDCCVKCNASAEGRRWNRKLWWHHPAFYLLIIFPGLLIYVIVALCVRKSATVSVGMCRKHQAVRRNAILLGWLLSLIGLTGLFGGIFMSADRAYRNSSLPALVIVAGLVALVVGLILGMLLSRVVYPTRIEGDYVWLRGAGEKFLGEIPPVNSGG